MKTDELREKYLTFFESKGHTRQASDVLVPRWDPSVLFTPAGMNPFKDHFLGKVKLEFTRATTCQKCLRTGDIDNVGRTAYHHTFFEMLGNFSFGDYFKKDAIHWAWEFLTGKAWLGIDPARLSVTVYHEDDEAAKIWSDEIGLPTSRIQRMGEDDNFWPAGAPSSGPDGVCGPCSEIFYHGDSGGEVEIWNLVFTQFNRVGEPPDNLRALPSRNIDTGMGLERMAAVMQGKDTNYHIDILRPLVEAAAEITGQKYEAKTEEGRRLRRIADHVRAGVFAIHENVYPGAQKENYVIRRLLRRAVLDGHQMGMSEPFLHQLTTAVVEQMRSAYPDLTQSVERVAGVIQQEEKAFFGVLGDALSRIDKIFGGMSSEGSTVIDGKQAAHLYQTYGVPPELFAQMGAEHGYTFDGEGFHRAMINHGGDTGPGKLFGTGPIESLKTTLHHTEFVGYEQTAADVEIKGLILKGGSEDQDTLCDLIDTPSDQGMIVLVLDRTPFYGESGGQVGDSGEIVGDNFLFRVVDTQKSGDLFLHLGHLVEGVIHTGDSAQAKVNIDRRTGIRRAHSATHVLHHALQSTLGSHAQQKGSKVDDDWLRFDFTNLEPVSGEHLEQIESQISQRLQESAPIHWETVPLATARQAGAMMLFGEKYPDPVRMVTMGEFSRELCGGTHLDNTQEIGRFELLAEEGVSAGVRRITALTGDKAEQHAQQTTAALQAIADHLGVALPQVTDAVRRQAQHVRDLKKELAGGAKASDLAPLPAASQTLDYPQIKAALRETARLLNVGVFDVAPRVEALSAEIASLQQQIENLEKSGDISADALIEAAEEIGGAMVIVKETPGANQNLMRQWIDQVRKKSKASAVLLAAAMGDDKVLLVAGVSRDLVAKGVSAGEWVKQVAPVVGGGGGGKPDLAQAGGKDPSKLPEAMAKAAEVIRQMLDKA
ncbi:alanine--tRNA ligase [Lignipirellula cremea]|uniref:Alanine--tRNA ligase n=1 Tax=Lignipirellula cremea TaxID=2528010 RepID=A0A518DNB0_9BACT|nr:alanine--tRNA ligase [Lignipirellula cremea]QDU93328.1 Alanine--tRNA ligase [Lignipirellula cremea]